MEDEIYTDVNDNVRYLRGGPLTAPTRALDARAPGTGGPYVSWIFWRFMSERFPEQSGTGLPVVIRDVWERAQGYDRNKPATYSMQAADKALRARGSSMAEVFAQFGEANRHPADAYREGRDQHYPTAPAIAAYTLSGSQRTISEKVATMAHMTNYTFVFRPGTGLAEGAWRLRVPLDMPDVARGSRAQVSVVRTDGTRRVSPVRLSTRGNGVATAPFNSSQVARVELTVTNSSQRYHCHQGSYLSCEGVPLDNGLKTYFDAALKKS
jgi:hypothetical protein